MGTKGKRKYKCDECGETRMVHWTERARITAGSLAGCGNWLACCRRRLSRRWK
jgi:hypothetical protein